MGDELRYATEGLEAKAHICETPRPEGPPEEANPPDMLLTTFSLWNKVLASASKMTATLKAGDREGERIAAALRAAAGAYKKVQDAKTAALNSQMNGSDGPPPAETAAPDMAGIPGSLPIPSPAYPSSSGEGDDKDWDEAAREIYSGDTQALSIKFLRDKWRDYQSVLEGHAANFSQPAEGWHGPAAEACAEAQRRLSSWWTDMGAECGRLAQEATTFADAHDKLVASHPTLKEVEEYYSADWEALGAAQNMTAEAAKQMMWDYYQTRSEDALEAYGRTTLQEIRPGKPPAIGGLPVVHDGEATHPGGPQTPGGPGAGPGGGAGAGGGGASGATPEMPKMPPLDPSMSPAGLDPSAGEKPSGSPSGGGSPAGGGSPSGGGAPAGGGAPGGLPEGMPEGGPEIPGLEEPSLKPASAGGGGGGTGGGGGMPAGPLGPAVGADSVAASPAGARGGVGPSGSSGGGGVGGIGGGMGGMGGGHGQGGQGKEKRRNPNLSEDESLYEEDREWTEAVIGHRPRKDVKDSKQ